FRMDLNAYTAPVATSTHTHAPTVQLPATGHAAEESIQGTDAASADYLLELGVRTLADLVAPAGWEVRSDNLRLDGQYARVLAVTAYPRTVGAGWLETLVDSDLPVELSLHVRPLPSAVVVRALGHQLVQLQASRLLDARDGRLADPEWETAVEDAEHRREALRCLTGGSVLQGASVV